MYYLIIPVIAIVAIIVTVVLAVWIALAEFARETRKPGCRRGTKEAL